MAAIEKGKNIMDAAQRAQGTTVLPKAAPSVSTAASSTSRSKRSSEDLVDTQLALHQWPTPELPQPRGDVSADALAFRRKATAAIEDCFQSELAASTVQSYDSILRVEVGDAADQLQTELLPMIEEAQFQALFGAVLAKHGPKTLHWSRVRALKSALIHWHKRRHTQCVFDQWTPSTTAFWNGLARQCSPHQPRQGAHQLRYCHRVPAEMRRRWHRHQHSQRRDGIGGVFRCSAWRGSGRL